MQPIIKVASAAEKTKLLDHFHTHPIEGGHTVQKGLYAKLRSRFSWKGMSRDVARLVKNCSLCHINKPKLKNKENLILTTTPTRPFHTIAIDTVGLFPTTFRRSKYVITIICDFAKYLICIPVPNKEAKTLARALVNECILEHGPVRTMKSDMDTEYVNSLMGHLAGALHISHSCSSPAI